MLLENIKRYHAMEHFKLVQVELYKAKGIALPPQVHSVPALYFQDSKVFLFGKQVFDYLLLPHKGFLLNLPKKEPTMASSSGQYNKVAGDTEPMCFSLHSGNSAFSFIENENEHDIHKAYNWSGIDENQTIPTVPEEGDGSISTSGGAETRTKKNLPDLGAIQSSRETELQQYLSGVGTGIKA